MDEEITSALRFGPMRTRDAAAIGIARGRLRQSGVAHPFPGVVALQGVDRLDALAARLDDRQFLSHVSAAEIWGIALPRRLRASALHVSTVVPHNAPRIDGVVGHRLREQHVETGLIDGVRITTPTETWRHLSTLLDLDELIAAGDSLMRRKRPLVAPLALVRAVDRHRGMRGAKRLRVALAAVRPGTDSAAETRLRLLIVDAGLPEPVVNQRVVLPGYGPAFPDLSYPAERVAIEYDGRQHLVDARQFERDIRRLEAFANAGWRVVRVLAAHLHAPHSLLARIRTARE